MNSAARELKTLLDRQHQNVSRLAAVLQDERAALTSGSIPGIEAAIEAKQICLQALEQDTRIHSDWLSRAGLAFNEQGIVAYLRHCDPEGRLDLEPLWRKIKESLSRCREQNLLNGKVVVIHQRQTLQALAILRGGTARDEACYNPTGHAPNGVASRTLGRV